MKNVLIVSPFFPYPLTSGGHQAIFNGMACLKGVANVYLVYTSRESWVKKGECAKLEEKLPFVKCVPYIEPSSKHNAAWVCQCVLNKLKQNSVVAKFLPKQNQVGTIAAKGKETPEFGFKVLPEGFQKYVNSLVRKYQIDIVQMEMMETIQLVDLLPQGVKKVFVHHELRWVRNELLLEQMNDAEEKKKQVEDLKKEEIAYLNQCDSVIVLSETDNKKLQQAGVKTEILTSFAVVDGFVYEKDVKKDNPFLLSYVGPSNHYPNYDGVLWFLRNCWQRLLEISPNYEFQIIGNWDETIQNEILNQYRNVCFLGFVEDLESAIDGSIEIVPLNIGSGIRMKILEAARLGVPVVSTSVGAEGLPLTNGKDILIADCANDFVSAICSLQEAVLRKSLIASMQQSILPMYSLDALGRNRMSVYK